MPKKGKTRTNKKYSPEFKTTVVKDLLSNQLSYAYTIKKYGLMYGNSDGGARLMIQRWERIYLEEGAEGLMKERRGRTSTDGPKRGRPPKLDKRVEEDLIAENQRLRMEIEYLKKIECLSTCGQAKEQQKALIVLETRCKYPLKELLNLSKLPHSTYCYYLCKTSKSDKYATIKQMILKAFNDSKQTYGYRRIELVLRQNGYVINHKTVLKLMNMLNLRVKVRKAKYKSYKGEVGKVAPNT